MNPQLDVPAMPCSSPRRQSSGQGGVDGSWGGGTGGEEGGTVWWVCKINEKG